MDGRVRVWKLKQLKKSFWIAAYSPLVYAVAPTKAKAIRECEQNRIAFEKLILFGMTETQDKGEKNASSIS